MWQVLTRWWACNVLFPRRQRAVFYEILGAQLGAGIAIGDACAAVGSVAVSPRMGEVARAAAEAEAQGRGAVEGLAGTGCLPVGDVRLLRVAERSASLAEALADLRAAQAARLGIYATVVGPNAYPLVVLAATLAACSQLGGFIASTLGEERVAGNRAVETSRLIAEYAPPALAAAGGLGLVAAFGVHRWRGPQRRLLLGLDGVHRAQVGIGFAALAARLTGRGASDVEVLDAAREAFGRGGFVGAAVRGVRRDVDGGVAIENAVPGRLLSPEYAAILKALVPRGERELYPRAYRTVAQVQEAVLRGKLVAAAGTVRTFALCGAFGLIAWMLPGVYALGGTLMNMSQQG